MLTGSEMISAAERRSGDGDEVKQDADGSAASPLGPRLQTRAQASCPGAVDTELLTCLLKAPVGVAQKETHVLTYWLTE